MTLIIRDLDQTRIHFQAAVQRVGEGAATTAFARALNKEGDKIRTKVRRALRHQTGIKAGVIRSQTKTIPATKARLSYKIVATGDHMSLAHFGAKQFSYGVRARPWGRSQQFKSAFIVDQLKGEVFIRKSKVRLPIRRLYGPSTPKELIKGASLRTFEGSCPAVLDAALRQLSVLFEH